MATLTTPLAKFKYQNKEMSKTEADENLGPSLGQAENSRRLKAVSGLGSIC